MIPCIIAAPYQGALKVSDLCDELHRVTASRAMQVKCKVNFWSSDSQQVHLIGRVVTKVNRVNAVWQARLANAEPQPSLVLATSWLRVQNYKNNQCETILSPNYFWEILKIKRWCIASHKKRFARILQSTRFITFIHEIAVFSVRHSTPAAVFPFSRFPVSSTRFAVLIIINIFILL